MHNLSSLLSPPKGSGLFETSLLCMYFTRARCNCYNSLKIRLINSDVIPLYLNFRFHQYFTLCLLFPLPAKLPGYLFWPYLLPASHGPLPTKRYSVNQGNTVSIAVRTPGHCSGENSFTCLPASIVSATMLQ